MYIKKNDISIQRQCRKEMKLFFLVTISNFGNYPIFNNFKRPLENSKKREKEKKISSL